MSMKIISELFRLLDRLKPAEIVYAHCDIPCGIYDSKPAQLAAETVEKMVEKILQLPLEGEAREILEARNSFVRMVKVKEEHAEICKREILILWTDFFKEENLKDCPNLHDLVWKTTKLCSKNKREVNPQAAKDLRGSVDKIAVIFNKVKAVSK